MTIKEVLGMLCADIDIFLLCEEDQTTTKDEVYTPEQIRTQLKESMHKMANALGMVGIDIDKEIKERKIKWRI